MSPLCCATASNPFARRPATGAAPVGRAARGASRPGAQPRFAFRLRQPGRAGSSGRSLRAAGIADDAVGGFLDLAKLVSAEGATKKSAYEDLAYKLGQDVYADFGGWHLYLRDMKGTGELKMSQVLAAAIGPMMSSKGFDDSEVEKLLKSVPVRLGGGKKVVSLHEVLPNYCMQDMSKICQDYARDL